MTRRTTIDIDDEVLALAQQALGTKGLKDTVEAAFDAAIRRMRREQLIELLQSDGFDTGPEHFEQVRPVR